MTNLAYLPTKKRLPEPDRESALETIRKISFKTGATFKLSSGRESKVYFNMKYAMLSPVGAVQFPLMILHKLREIGCDAIGGLEMGAVPVISSTAAVGALYGQPVNAFFIRKEAKGHGTRERVEGTLIETLKDSAVAVVDDVTTTGGSAMTAVGVLRELQIDVRNVITIVDREEGASETFAAEGLALHALFRKSEFAHDLT